MVECPPRIVTLCRPFGDLRDLRITCPSCDASYEVQATALRPGRKVKCARCGESWIPAPPAPPRPEIPPPAELPEQEPEPEAAPAHPLPPPPVLDGPTAMDRLAAEAPPAPAPTNPWPLRGAWIGSVAVLLLCILAVRIWAEPIARAWPASQRILGVPAIAGAPVR